VLVELPSSGKAKLIGDPHLGRSFDRGTPPHRRGEREKSQFAKFVSELCTTNVDYNIMVGDLFEHPHVSRAVVVAAAEAYLTAAELFPDTTFAALAGNHDLSRDVKVIAAWQLFEKIVAGRRDNLLVISEPCSLGEIALLPWQWGVTAVEQLEGLPEDCKIAVGHWDLQSFGGDDSHLCPTRELKELGVEQIYSGHYHVAGLYTIAGHLITCTGSLEPFTHAEDPPGDLYVTLSLEEALERDDLHDKVVRLELKSGEVVPADFDCLSLTTRAAQVEAEEVFEDDEFDWKNIMSEALAELTPEVRDFINERISTQ
jgi:hypothetical protein